MPGYTAQSSNAYPPQNFSRPTKSIRLGDLKGATSRTPESASEQRTQDEQNSTTYPAYPPPPYSRGLNKAARDALANPVSQGVDETYVEGNLFGEIVPSSRRSSRNIGTIDAGSTKRGSKRRHKPNLSIDTSVAKSGSKPKQIKRVGRLEPSSRSMRRHDSVKSTRSKDLVFLAPTVYNMTSRSNPRAPSSVYSRDTMASRPTPNFATNSAYRQLSNPRDSATTDFEEDEISGQKERVLSTGTVFEEDQALRPRSNTGDSTVGPMPRRSKGWWNVITTPFQAQKRFTQQVAEMEKVPDVPTVPQLYSTKPKPKDVSENLRISPEEVRRYLASGASSNLERRRARQNSNRSSATSIDMDNGEEYEQQHNRLNSAGGPRHSERSTAPSRRGTARYSEFSPDDREVPIMLRGDPADMLPRHSTSSRRAQPNQWLANLRASENQPVSTWSPLTSNQDDSPESQRSHFHSPVVHPAAIDSVISAHHRTQSSAAQPAVQNAASRATKHSPDAFAWKRSSHSAQWDNDARGVPAVPYRPDDQRSPYYNTKSTPGVGRHKPTSSFTFSEPPEEKKRKTKKKRRRCCCWLCIIILLLLLLAVAIAVPVVVTRKHHSSSPSIWVNLTDFPPMPTGALTIAQPNMVYNVTGCVNPSAMWSCAVPKEQQAAIAPNAPDQPDFLFTIYYVNQNSTSSSTPDFQPSPGPPALDEQTFLGNTTDNNTQPFAGVDTPFYISFNPPTTASSPSKLRKAKRQGGSNGINTSQTSLGGSLPTSSASSAASSTINTIPNLATAIPLPSTNPDGTALPANLLPFPLYQPIRLYNRGLPTEHYGFYTYFSRAIFMKSITIENSTEQAEGDIPADANGGSTFEGANARCTWSDTRFLVQIWTRMNATLLPKATATSSAAAGGTITSFVRPGTMPYPVTVTLDRHGGGLTTKMLYCYGLDSRGDVVVNEKVFQPEDRGFGGTLVNPAEGPFTSVNVSTADGGPGGIDGGTGGCACRWQNF